MANPHIKVIMELLDKFSPEADKVGKSSDGLKDKIAGVGKAFAAFAALVGAGAFLKHSIDQARESEDAFTQLKQAVESTGGAAGFTAEQLRDQADALAKLSNFSSAAVQGGLSRLLTYTAIQGDMFKQASQAALDMAQFLKIDVATAAEKVGNALNYPTQSLSSLTKQGFRFTEQQKAQIEHFEKNGEIAKAQAIIMGELELAYGGQAGKAAETFTGRLGQMKKQFDNVADVVGRAIINNDHLNAGMGLVATTLANVAEFIGNNSDAFSELTNRVLVVGKYFYDLGASIVDSLLNKAFAPMIDFVQRNIDKFKEIALIIYDVGKVVLEFAVKIINNVLAPAFGALQLILNPFREFLLNGLVIAFRVVGYTIAELANGIDLVVSAIKIGLGTAMETIGNFATAGKSVLKKFGFDLKEGMAEDMRDAGKAMASEGKAGLEKVNTIAQENLNKLLLGRRKATDEEVMIVSEHNAKMLSDAKGHGKDMVEATTIKTEEQLKAEKKLAEERKKIDDKFRAEQLKVEKEIIGSWNRVFGETLPPLVKKVRDETEKLRETLLETSDEDQMSRIAHLIGKYEELIPLFQRIEDSNEEINKLQTDPQPFKVLQAMAIALRGMREDAEKLPKDSQAYHDALKAIEEQQKKLETAGNALVESEKNKLKVIDTVTGELVTQEELTARIRDRNEETYGQIVNVARGIVGAIDGAKGLGAEMTSLMQNVITIADLVPKISTLGKDGKSIFDATALFGAIGAMTGVLGSIFGDSPADKARKAAIQKNTEALDKLARSNQGLLELNAPGSDIRAAEKILPEYTRLLEMAQNDIRNRDFENAGKRQQQAMGLLMQAGLSKTDIDEMASALGIDLKAAGIGGLKQLLEGLQMISGGSVFGTGFKGEMEQLNRSRDARGEDDAEGLFKGIAGILQGQGLGGNVNSILGGVDFSKASSRKDAADALADIIANSTSEEILAMSGNLSPGEFLDTLQDLIELLREDAENGAPPPPPADPPSEDEEDDFTDVGPAPDGDGIVDAPSADTWKADILASARAREHHQEQMLKVLTDTFVLKSPVAGISILDGNNSSSSSALSNMRTSLVIENINIGSEVDPADAELLVGAAIDGAAAALNRALGDQTRIDEIFIGKASIK